MKFIELNRNLRNKERVLNSKKISRKNRKFRVKRLYREFRLKGRIESSEYRRTNYLIKRISIIV